MSLRTAATAGMKGHGSHSRGGMAHDMSDPALAASMETDIRNDEVAARYE